MSWGGGWDQARCEAVDANGQRCALAPGHADEHRTSEAIAAQERDSGPWRVLILVAVFAIALGLVWAMQGRL